jgi:hypothetical protein
VAAIYRDLVPALNGLSTDRVYDLILSYPDLLDGCFQVFRKRPAAFRKVLLDGAGQAVETDDQPLSCGRTVAQIVAMALRSSAHRYLRRELGGPSRRRPPRPPQGLLAWLKRQIAPPPPPRPAWSPGPGDRLYKALSDLLQYEWQARLIPFYAPLPESLVREMGDRLLDYRTPEDLTRLAAEARALSTAPRAAVMAEAPSPPRFGGLREEDIWTLYQEADLHRRLGAQAPQQGRRLVALAAALGPLADEMLKTELALGRLPSVAATCACAEIFGPGRFLELFSEPEDGFAVGAWRQALRDSALGAARGADAICQAAAQAAMMTAATVASRGATGAPDGGITPPSG